jgi:hypothetical protein
LTSKYKGNGHNIIEKFVLAITYCHIHSFKNRFGQWSAFLLYFKKTPIKTIIMAISLCAIMANIVKMAIMAVMANTVMARTLVFMGDFIKYSKNADHWQKRCLKICMW